MLHLKKYENVFDNINDISDESFWEKVIQHFGSLRNIKPNIELLFDIDEEMIEFGLDYGTDIYNLAFSKTANGLNWTFDVNTYPDGNTIIRNTKIQMINDPTVMAAFLAVIMPE